MATSTTVKKAARALGSGLAGSAALTAIHETARRTVDRPPRMDVIGKRALARTLRAVGVTPPRGRRLFRETLLGDLAANALYYSLVELSGRRSGAWRRGSLLGTAAGIGAAVLPPVLGLGGRPRARRLRTPALTVAWYLAGGLAAAAVVRLLTRDDDDIESWEPA
jgi:hypothetical protein